MVDWSGLVSRRVSLVSSNLTSSTIWAYRLSARMSDCRSEERDSTPRTPAITYIRGQVLKVSKTIGASYVEHSEGQLR